MQNFPQLQKLPTLTNLTYVHMTLMIKALLKLTKITMHSHMKELPHLNCFITTPLYKFNKHCSCEQLERVFFSDGKISIPLKIFTSSLWSLKYSQPPCSEKPAQISTHSKCEWPLIFSYFFLLFFHFSKKKKLKFYDIRLTSTILSASR